MRSCSGLIDRSSVATMYQVGFVFQAGFVTLWVNASVEIGTCDWKRDVTFEKTAPRREAALIWVNGFCITRSTCPSRSRTTKQAGVSSTDQCGGGGRRRSLPHGAGGYF